MFKDDVGLCCVCVIVIVCGFYLVGNNYNEWYKWIVFRKCLYCCDVVV